MRPLETNRFVLTLVHVYPADESVNKWQKRAYAMFGVIVISLNLSAFLMGGSFFLKHQSIDLEQALFALVQMPATASLSYIALTTFFLRHRITAIFNRLSSIYESSWYLPHFLARLKHFLKSKLK